VDRATRSENVDVRMMGSQRVQRGGGATEITCPGGVQVTCSTVLVSGWRRLPQPGPGEAIPQVLLSAAPPVAIVALPSGGTAEHEQRHGHRTERRHGDRTNSSVRLGFGAKREEPMRWCQRWRLQRGWDAVQTSATAASIV
jgi:hypothetical protein